jgi:hypothetical protein
MPTDVPVDISVRDLIKILLDQEMDDQVIFRDKDENRLHNVKISTQKFAGLGALFG